MIYLPFVAAVACFISGLWLQRYLTTSERYAHVLNNFVIWVALPAMILRAVTGIQLTGNALLPVLIPWFSFGLAYSMVVFLAKQQHWPSDIRTAVIILVGLGNTAFLGVPLVALLLGPGSVAYAVIYDQLGSFILLSTVAVGLIANQSSAVSDAVSRDTRTAAILLGALVKVIKFPPFICLLASVLLPIDPLVDFFAAPLDFLSTLILPIALLVVGLHFTFSLRAEDVAYFTWVLLIKLLLLPLLVLLIYFFFGEHSKEWGAILLQSAMPPMITPALLLIAAGIAPRLVATVLGYSTLLGCVTVVLWSVLWSAL